MQNYRRASRLANFREYHWQTRARASPDADLSIATSVEHVAPGVFLELVKLFIKFLDTHERAVFSFSLSLSQSLSYSQHDRSNLFHGHFYHLLEFSQFPLLILFSCKSQLSVTISLYFSPVLQLLYLTLKLNRAK